MPWVDCIIAYREQRRELFFIMYATTENRGGISFSHIEEWRGAQQGIFDPEV